MGEEMLHRIGVVVGLLILALAPAHAQDLITKKQVFELSSFTTQSGRTLKNVKVGWESYGTLNADKSNAILICHFFSGTGHAAGKYAEAEKVAGYWDAIIGPGKAIDTTKYFVFSSDTLVNLSPADPNVTTTGPASIDPDTGKPYGYLSDKNDKGFPIVSIRDFIEVQKKLVDSLGIKKLHMVGGASMGGIQTYEWAAVYPDMVSRIMPVISSAEPDAGLIDWLDIWAMPIRLDPNWNGGDYYGKEAPLAGLCTIVEDRHASRADQRLGYGCVRLQVGEGRRQPLQVVLQPLPGRDGARQRRHGPRQDVGRQQLPVPRQGQPVVCRRCGRAHQGDQGARPAHLQPRRSGLPGRRCQAHREQLKSNGVTVEQVELQGNRGHLDGVLNIKQAEQAISGFLAK